MLDEEMYIDKLMDKGKDVRANDDGAQTQSRGSLFCYFDSTIYGVAGFGLYSTPSATSINNIHRIVTKF